MTTVVRQFHILLLIAFITPPTLIIISATTPPPQHFPIARPGCDSSCGNISIPFPFGTTPDCYRNSSFWVTCVETSNPPQLFMWNYTTNVEIANISLNAGQLKVMRTIVRRCYDQDGTLIDPNVSWMTLPYLFAINNTANKFTVVGCDSYGYISGRRWGSDQYFSTGCVTTCQRETDVEDDSCTGSGCCQISRFPDDTRSLNLTAGSFSNHTDVWAFSNCTYGFLAEDGFRFHRDNLTNLLNVRSLPIVVDWVISEETCEDARRNNSNYDYACQASNSECYEPNIDQGYRCRCKVGYEGNPYLPGGCIDVNECDYPEIHRCAYHCVNSEGNFTCNCPDGFNGDPTREGGCSAAQINDSKKGEPPIFKPIAGGLLGIIIFILVICLVFFELKRRRQRKMKQVYFLRNGGMLLQEKLTASSNMMSIGMEREMSSNNDVAKVFSSSELQHATDNFHDRNIIGQGGFGTVYKGSLHDKRIVAIKKSKEVDPGQIDQFINEVVVLSRVSHRNIVKLLGCCLETQAPLLVYEFISNGTLHDHLHNETRKRFLDWNRRLKIATETADVLQYLHSAAAIPIIHRDVKSANILLDQTFEAKVSDFGASRLVPVDQTQLSTMVQGTFGYLDPEYMQTNQLTEKSDVYSFGVVLVELITGMKPLSYDRPEEQRNLTSFFLCKLQQGGLLDILDETIVGDKRNLEQITEVAKLARVCLNVKGQDRPSMKEVAMELEGLRLGGKHSWVKFEQNVEEMEPLCGNVSSFSIDDNGYSTSIGYVSFRDQAKLNGGR